ncbi:helix-turn-helix domain containing protein [Aphanothece hegewaldii CCALA 016]|uniref:Helix-turn-helix domain containing protein n=1 Tax=Aphanothece hegewaldii CCALA 016 TaxID=2107694 RepID=A0A2T1M3B1_9CHRO|nr:helix-turn-helix domain containing protein [Aphanothece hegewaldii]PSF39308.1 helix-turn-helix domain containing protein [Aphanothece hegewaldii CCALA 016]
MATVDQDFAEARNQWDLETLYKDLASVKGKSLTPVEKQHLRGLLSGYSPSEIAQKLQKSVKGVEIAFCNTVYQYVKNLVGQSNGKVENWRNISEWLEAEGYKHQTINGQNIIDYSSLNIVVKECEITVKNCNLTLKNNNLYFDLNIRLATPLSSDVKGFEDLEDKELQEEN